MAKKQEIKEETFLKMGKEEFKSQIDKQIQIGNELLRREVKVYPAVVYTRLEKDLPVDEDALEAFPAISNTKIHIFSRTRNSFKILYPE